MNNLTESPNIGDTLAMKLEKIGITSLEDLMTSGSIDAFNKLASQDRDGVCLIMLYALEGTVQGIRWHGLSQERKDELRTYYKREFL